MKKLIASLFSLALVFAFSVHPTFAAGDKDCKDFKTWQEAQNYFVSHGGSKTNNVDGLDRDHDGIACESLKGSTSSHSNPSDHKTTTKPVHHSAPTTVHHSTPTHQSTPTNNNTVKNNNSTTTEKTTSSHSVTNTVKPASGGKLPKTATNYPTLILMGALLLAAGLATRQLAKN